VSLHHSLDHAPKHAPKKFFLAHFSRQSRPLPRQIGRDRDDTSTRSTTPRANRRRSGDQGRAGAPACWSRPLRHLDQVYHVQGQSQAQALTRDGPALRPAGHDRKGTRPGRPRPGPTAGAAAAWHGPAPRPAGRDRYGTRPGRSRPRPIPGAAATGDGPALRPAGHDRKGTRPGRPRPGPIPGAGVDQGRASTPACWPRPRRHVDQVNHTQGQPQAQRQPGTSQRPAQLTAIGTAPGPGQPSPGPATGAAATKPRTHHQRRRLTRHGPMPRPAGRDQSRSASSDIEFKAMFQIWHLKGEPSNPPGGSFLPP